MIVYRLSKSKYSRDLSGSGAEKTGGRWNSRGKALIYTSSSRALCALEIAVHTPLGIIPRDYELVSIEIPDSAMFLEIKTTGLPADWKSFPHPGSTQAFGDNFIASGKQQVLKVPSAVVQGDYNYLINPQNSGHSKIRIISIEPFEFDERLFNK